MYVYLSTDSTTHRLNKVLIDSGFAPEWITLDKEIRRDIKLLRNTLMAKRKQLGPQPFTKDNSLRWKRLVQECDDKVAMINRNIDKFNMIVPILNKQKIQMRREREIKRMLEEFGYGQANEEFEDERESARQQKEGVFVLIRKYWTRILKSDF